MLHITDFNRNILPIKNLSKSSKIGNSNIINFYNASELIDCNLNLVKYGNIIYDESTTDIIVYKDSKHITYHNYYFYTSDNMQKAKIIKKLSDKLNDGFVESNNFNDFVDYDYHTNPQIQKINILLKMILKHSYWNDEDIKNLNSLSKIKFVLCGLGKKLVLSQMLFLNEMYKKEKTIVF